MHNMLNNEPSKDILISETFEGYFKWQKEFDRHDKVMDLKISFYWII